MAKHVWLLEPGTTRKHSLLCERRTDRSGAATWWCSVDGGEYESTGIDGDKDLYGDATEGETSASMDLALWFRTGRTR